jgi:NAD(P)-dependent dehydrogenase (short-subunit alcohol dehydrogenase family)
MPKNIVVTGAASGFGALTARRLADAGHTVYAPNRDTDGRYKQAVSDAPDYAGCHDVQLRTMDLRAEDDGLLVTRFGIDTYQRVGLADLLHPTMA